jgi:hypothetical protein
MTKEIRLNIGLLATNLKHFVFFYYFFYCRLSRLVTNHKIFVVYCNLSFVLLSSLQASVNFIVYALLKETGD